MKIIILRIKILFFFLICSNPIYAIENISLDSKEIFLNNLEHPISPSKRKKKRKRLNLKKRTIVLWLLTLSILLLLGLTPLGIYWLIFAAGLNGPSLTLFGMGAFFFGYLFSILLTLSLIKRLRQTEPKSMDIKRRITIVVLQYIAIAFIWIVVLFTLLLFLLLMITSLGFYLSFTPFYIATLFLLTSSVILTIVFAKLIRRQTKIIDSKDTRD